MSISERKKELREKLWGLLEERGVARFPRPAWGRIPNFQGSEAAARRILDADEFDGAEVLKRRYSICRKRIHHDHFIICVSSTGNCGDQFCDFHVRVGDDVS